MIIDAHQHFWKLERDDYGWLTPDLKDLYRDFLPEDLKPHLDFCGIDRTILVQAAPTIKETQFLLNLAKENEFIAGVVGWIDFESSDATEQVSDFAGNRRLVGLRPMIQDIPDPEWILRPQNEPVFQAMANHHLVFDALVLPIHLKHLHAVVDRHPDLTVVIDHAAKPPIQNAIPESWFEDIASLAAYPKVSCKLSGLITEAATDWKPEDLSPVIDHLLSSFGPDRLIWGSDWPVLNLAGDYRQWYQTSQNALRFLTEPQLASIFGGNAQRIYLTN